MNRNEATVFALLAIVLVAVVLFSMKGGGGTAVASTEDEVGISQDTETANQTGPAYLVGRMPYGYGPPVTMQAPVITQGFQGQSAAVER